jgi:cell division protein FtsI/penicillin-binding protein 2
MAQTVSQKGNACQLHLQADAPLSCSLLGIKEEHFNSTLEGMVAACSPGGTAYPFFPRNGQLQTLENGAVACKTGTAEFGGADEQGYRKTHGWFVAVVSPIFDISSAQQPSGSSTQSQLHAGPLNRETWLQAVSQKGFPKTITITVLVESDDTVKFREGSHDAAPVAKKILDWIEGKATVPVTPTAVELESAE